MNPTFKKHLVSAGITFVSTFLASLAVIITAVPAETISDASSISVIAAILLAGVRGAIKPAIEKSLAKFLE